MAPSAPSNHPTHPSRASNTSETSTTATQTQTNPYTSTPVLRLRATGPAPSARRRIQWAEDVVDNEGLGRKRSKVCCIYHAPHPVGESSDESSDSDSSSGDDSDQSEGGGGDDGKARMGGKGKEKRRRKPHEGDGGKHDGCAHDHHRGDRGGTAGKRKNRNAYEAVPKKGKAAAVEVKT